MYAVVNKFCIYRSGLLLLEIMLFLLGFSGGFFCLLVFVGFFVWLVRIFFSFVALMFCVNCELQHVPELLWVFMCCLAYALISIPTGLTSSYVLEQNKILGWDKEVAFYYLLLSKSKNVKT